MTYCQNFISGSAFRPPATVKAARPSRVDHKYFRCASEASMIRSAAMLLLCAAPAVAGAAVRDPDWPCQQIKVPELSLAAVWSGPSVDPRQTAWQDDQPVADLVRAVASRRTPIDQAQALVHDFAQHATDRKQPRLLALLAGVFNVLDAERDSVMAGLDRFGGRQKQLAAEIRSDNENLHTLQADPASDPNTVQQLVRQVTWKAELFQDRRQAISYACDAPGKIEQRLFALAHQIQQELE